ncbi:low temperature responsive protein [Scheffersomyces amazonensis]|uniref:low temperature responsive protein n=1 Tax=Scheffersomyces amazonensis TaxID=1078765 RepID=UPI00315C8786
MGHPVRLIYEQPNIENTIPFSEFQRSFPEKFSPQDDDKLILYGGCPSVSVHLQENNELSRLEISSQLHNVNFSRVSLYVLNTSLILWFINDNIGLEIPYQSIILHAIKKIEGSNSSHLYIQIISNGYIASIPNEYNEFISSIELNIIPNIEYDFNSNPNPLLQVVDSTVEQLYDALSKCSALHYDTESEPEEDSNYGNIDTQLPALQLPKDYLNNGEDEIDDVIIKNSGDADDLGNDDIEVQDAQVVAGMAVDVGFASLSGTVRKREDEVVDNNVKTRRVN